MDDGESQREKGRPDLVGLVRKGERDPTIEERASTAEARKSQKVFWKEHTRAYQVGHK